MTSKLTPKQAKFVNEYLIDNNATQAAIRAGYSSSTARQIGAENLTKPVIESAIETALNAQAERTQITADRVLAEIAKLAFYNPQDFIGEDGQPKKIDELDADAAAAIKEIEVSQVSGMTISKLKLADKGQNLERLGKHFKLFTDRLDMSGEMTVSIDASNLSDDALAHIATGGGEGIT